MQLSSWPITSSYMSKRLFSSCIEANVTDHSIQTIYTKALLNAWTMKTIMFGSYLYIHCMSASIEDFYFSNRNVCVYAWTYTLICYSIASCEGGFRVYIYRMCRVWNSSFPVSSWSYRLHWVSWRYHPPDSLYSSDRQAIVGLLRVRSASNHWILFVGISSRQRQIAQQELSNFALTTLSCQFAAQGLHIRCNPFDFYRSNCIVLLLSLSLV